MANSAKTLARGAAHISRRIVVSYVLDWILIIGIAAIGGGFYKVKGNERPFNLADASISYPLKPDTVTTEALLLTALLAPAVITLIVSLLFIPGPTAHRDTPRALIWRRKLWEWNMAWMGLGLALASAFTITEGLKDLAGKPRPHALAVCDPDLSNGSIERNKVGGLGSDILSSTGTTPIIVAATICRNADPKALRDAFASWPSGHSSFSVAGLLYLSLFLCAKFAVYIPYVTTLTGKSDKLNTYDFDLGLRSHDHGVKSDRSDGVPPRNSAAAAPIYLLVLAVYVPLGTASFICVSRWFDFHHHGIDIFSGAVIGAFTALFAFRYYHMSIRSGSGWAWGARSRQRAFWVGVGRDGYCGDEGWMSGRSGTDGSPDLEANGGKEDSNVVGPGLTDHRDGDARKLHEQQQQQQQQRPALESQNSARSRGEQGYTITNGKTALRGDQ